MENNQQNKKQESGLENDRSKNTDHEQSIQNVESRKKDSDHLSSTSERHSESSLPKGTNETLGTP